MPAFVITVLKVVFLALLYFFVYRAVRAVVADLDGGAAAAGEPRAKSTPRAKPSRGKLPRTLVVRDEGGRKLDERRMEGTIQIGRADACQVQLADTYASSFHARIFSKDGNWFVEDLGSTNGTYLNKQRITTPSEVQAGDRVQVGKTVLELRR